MTDKKYPHVAGHKGDDETGKAAAAEVSKTIGRRQREVMEVVATFGADGATPLEVAAILDRDIDLVRPRMSELKEMKRLWPVGMRDGGRGRDVRCLSVVKPPEDEAA